jgi:hypothetical protein
MVAVHKYRIRCLTENKWETVWDTEEPTVCPSNNAHTIDGTLTTIINSVEQETIEIDEGIEATGGHFQTQSLKIIANAGETGYTKIKWPFPVSALAVNFVTDEENIGDRINMYAGKDSIIGAITCFCSPASPWENKDYVKGEKVTYYHPYHGESRIYTCIANTVGNALPINPYHPVIPENEAYWCHGYELTVSDTVIEQTSVGYDIKLMEGANVSDMGRVLYVKPAAKIIYLEGNPSFNHSPLSPTYVGQRVYFLRDYIVDKTWERNIGDSKIGGASIPKDVYIHAEYYNHGPNTITFVGHSEISY